MMTVSPQFARAAWSMCRRATFFTVLFILAAPAQAQESLPVLARIGPWPEASNLIGYQDKLWLVNSVKWENHNGADLHTYDPGTGDVRYERHLFSQDAGRLVIRDGLLYWPFEDSRASMGWGQFAVTDGSRWRLGVIPTGQIFHTHAMAVLPGGRLIAATSAWHAGLDVSDDGGRTWRRIYEHPTPEGRVSRITDLFVVGDGVIGPLSEASGRRLLVSDGEGARDLPGWPGARPLHGATVFRGWFYGLVGGGDGTSVWRSDGTRSEQVAAPRAGWAAVDLAADEDGLWAVGSVKDGGALWFSADGVDWQQKYALSEGTPREVTIFAGQPYAAGAGDDNRGILWGPPPKAAAAATAPLSNGAPSVDDLIVRGQGTSIDWAGAEARLDAVLDDSETYASHRGALRDVVYELARAGPPSNLFGDRLDRPVPDKTLTLIGGATQASAQTLARWTLLWGMALTGTGRVPLDLISEPWAKPANRAEKYFAVPPAAMWAAAAVGQKDGATIEALMERLERTTDPLWLRGDAVGALNALTGQRFGYDTAAWRKWWAETASRYRG